jgi:hypothetical protein
MDGRAPMGFGRKRIAVLDMVERGHGRLVPVGTIRTMGMTGVAGAGAFGHVGHVIVCLFE